MAACSAAVAALSTFYPDSLDPRVEREVEVGVHRLIAKMPTLASYAFKHSIGQPFMFPDNRLSYVGNFLHLMFATPCEDFEVDPVVEKAIDLLLILHADHEQNCSTSTVRMAGSSGANPYSAIAAGISALWGPAHGGANEAVLRMLKEIGNAKNIPKFVEKAKDRDDPFRLMGFGHRVYKNFDPRATIIREMCHKVLKQMGRTDSPLFDLALELEQVALKDEYFIEKNLYPNVDFYSGIIYRALGIPTSMFTVMFAIGRTVGWVAHWREMITDPAGRISRPRQLYTGPSKRDYVAVENR
jgi:citrate synthase